MNILIYDLELFDSGTRYPLKTAFEQLGYSVDMFDWTYCLFNHPNTTIITRIIRKFFHKLFVKKVNQQLQWVLKNGNYDAFLVLMGKDLYPETIKLAKNRIRTVINWNTDDILNLKSSSKFVLKSIDLYDAHFTPRYHLKDEYLQMGAKDVIRLDWYYRHGLIDRSFSCGDRDLLKKYSISFVGAWSSRRAEILSNLYSLGCNVFGWGWRKKVIHYGCREYIHNGLTIVDMMNVFRNSKINVNILTSENRDTTNLRVYEIMAVGGFQICERSEDITRIFEEDKEIVCFSSAKELVEKCNYYLSNDDLRNIIAENGYKKLLSGNNSLIDRIKTIDNYLKKYE